MKRPALLAVVLAAAPQAVCADVYLPTPVIVIEGSIAADFNGDGLEDRASVYRNNNDSRELVVVTSYRKGTDIGEHPPQVLPLDTGPLVDATLEMKGNVLLLKELTGGTTAVASTHRFRWDGRLQAMRLIGLDATLYSRTFAHDGQEASWNLLTGDLVTRTLRLNKGPGDQAYDTVGETKRKKPSPPLRLEDSPSGDDLLGWPGAK